MVTEKLSLKDARKLFLYSQGLLNRNQFGLGKNAVLKSIEQLGYLQIDTISVIERAHHHTLLNRVGNYEKKMLDRLVSEDRKLFEYWFHAASFLPIRDYRYYLPIMRNMARLYPADKKMAKFVLSRISAEGPLQSKDFENTGGQKSSGWWDWKPAKRALERLFLEGELMISRREGFQKVYDLKENVLPSTIETMCPSESEWLGFISHLMIKALGFGSLHDISYIRQSTRKMFKQSISKGIQNTLDELCEAGEFVEFSLDGTSYYTTQNIMKQLPLKQGKKRVSFLSPFDNLVINRKRTLDLFNFDYQLECYVPAAKRKYGYFSLPILYGDQLIGRMDSKADRSKKVFLVKNLHLEENVKVTDSLQASLASRLQEFSLYHGCESISIEKTQGPKVSLIN